MVQSPRKSAHWAYCTVAAVPKSEGLTPSDSRVLCVAGVIVFAVGLALFRCSYATKKNSLSLLIGPPTLPTKSSTCRLGLTTPPGTLGLHVFRMGQELAALGHQKYCAVP